MAQSANSNSPTAVQGIAGGVAIPVSVDTTGTSATQVQGTAADGAAAVGNPVQVGGKDGSGNAQALSVNADGVLVTGKRQTGVDGRGNSYSSAITATGTDDPCGVYPFAFNGTTWDRQRNNINETVLASAARTATVQSADFTNYNGRGLHLVIAVSAVTATPSVVFTIQGKDAVSGLYYTVLTSAAITATGTTVLKVYPGITASANASASDILPRTWRVDATHANADSISYSVGASVIL